MFKTLHFHIPYVFFAWQVYACRWCTAYLGFIDPDPWGGVFLFWEVSGGKTTPALLQTNSFHLTHSGRKMSFLLGPGLFSGAKWLLVSWSVTGFSSITFWSFWGKSQGINASESDQKDVPIISHWLTLRGSNGLRLRVSPNGGLAEWQMVAAFFLQFQMLDDDWW